MLPPETPLPYVRSLGPALLERQERRFVRPEYVTGKPSGKAPRLGEALREVGTAQQLDPLSPIINARVGSALYYLHRYDEAAAELREALKLDSSNISARAELGRVLVQQRRFPEALAAFPEALDLQAGYLGGGSGGATPSVWRGTARTRWQWSGVSSNARESATSTPRR